MHSCKLTRNFLIDYALGEESTPQAREAPAQLADCPHCQTEYAAIRNTLRVSRQALSSASPADEFWPGYHARLKEKLVTQQQDEVKQYGRHVPSKSSALGLGFLSAVWRFATASVRLPIPAALAILLVVGFLSYNVRSLSREPVNAIPSNTDAASANSNARVTTRIVEVPVVQERVVTRTVYVERKARRSQGSHGGVPVSADPTATENRRSAESSNKTAMSLAGFKPTDQVKLTVIKGSYQDEK